jgi:heptosyltransferase-2
MDNIAVFSPNWIGDQIMAYPFFSQLRVENPHAKIHVFCRPWVASLQFQKQVDFVHICSGWKGVFSLATNKNLKKGVWTKGYCLNKSLSSRIGLLLLGSKKRFFFSEKKLQHRSLAYTDLLKTTAHPVFFNSPQFDPKREWPCSPLKTPHPAYFVVAPSSQAPSRQWDITCFIELIKKIKTQTQMSCVVVGSKKDFFLGQKIQEHTDCLNLAGASDVAQLYALFQNSHRVIANDSGLAHTAALCGAKVHVIWGAGNLKKTAPLGDNLTFSTSTPDCWPCEKNHCLRENEKNLCLSKITVEDVFEALCL